MVNHLEGLEAKDKTHYHKGLGYHNLAIAHYYMAFQNFLYAYIEDVISLGKEFPLTPARIHLAGLFKASEEDLQKLGKQAIHYNKNGIAKAEEILKKVEQEYKIYAELWKSEYMISLIEKQIRECIKKILPHDKIIDNGKKKDIEKQMEDEKNLLGRQSSKDYIDYLTLGEYKKIINNYWNDFKGIFNDKEEFNKKFEIMRLIRNKIAHFRKIHPDDIKKLEKIGKWFGEKLKNCLQQETSIGYFDSKDFAISGSVYTHSGFGV